MKEQRIPPSNSAHHEQAIQLFLRELASLLTLKYSLTLTLLWCFAWGTVALAMRAGFGTSRKALLWGAGGMLIAIIVAVVKAGRQLPTPASIRSLLDQQNECGGLLMKVFAHRLIARDTVEEKVLQLQSNKRNLADAIISADNSLIRDLGREDLELLLS